MSELELAQAIADIERRERELADRADDLTRRTAEVEAAEARIADATATASVQAADLIVAKRQAQEQVEEAEARALQADAARRDMAAQIVEAREEEAHLRDTITRLRQSRNAAQAEAESLRFIISTERETARLIAGRVEAADKANDRLSSALAAERTKASAYLRDRTDATTALQSARGDLRELRAAAEAAAGRAAQQIETLTRKLREAENEIARLRMASLRRA